MNLFLIPVIFCNVMKKYMFNVGQSLLGPPVKPNGLSDNYIMNGNVLVISHSSLGYSYSQLGSLFKKSKGSVISKKRSKDDMRIDFKFKIFHQERNNQQVHFWFSDEQITSVEQLKKGACFTVNYTQSGAYLSVMYGENLQESQLQREKVINLIDKDIVFRMEKLKNKLKFSVGSTNNMALIHEISHEIIKNNMFFGVQVKQNDGASKFLLTGIRGYDILDNVKGTPEGESRFGFFSWIIFLALAGGLGYYLYQNYAKYK